MKAVILAAGEGTRLKKYTKTIPKCMLPFLGKTILQRQVDLLRECGITDIIVVRGYLSNKIDIEGVKYLEQAESGVNMLVNFFLSKKEFDDDILMIYGDILFEEDVLRKVIDFEGEVGCVVDINWRDYWMARHGSDKEDTESLELDADNIVSLGDPNPINKDIDARYIGMVKFSKGILNKAEKVYGRAKNRFWDKPWYNSPSLKEGYMTDFLQALIDNGVKVKAIKISQGWLEFDTVNDYEKALAWAEENSLKRFYNSST